jgi:hypothetical protein
MDSDDYIAVRDEDPTCPRCGRVKTAGIAVCAECGHDSQARPTTCEPFENHWEPGLSFVQRVRVFFICQGVGLTMLVIAALLRELVPAMFSWVLITAMLAFLLGTYKRIDLKRNQRGRVALTQTWRICFLARPPTRMRLSEYDDVVNGLDRDADFWDWLLLFVLLGFFLVPGIIWWYVAIHSDRFFVALSKHQGAPEDFLYRGSNQELMKDMARSIKEVGFPAPELPHGAKP